MKPCSTLLLLLLLFGYSSTTLPAQSELSPCAKFPDAPDPDKAETNYVLYRDFLRAREWERAFELWKEVYEVAPAADGQRNTVYEDGIRFYEYFIKQTGDSLKKQAYVDSIFIIYDEMDRCYPEGGYIKARKAFDLFYKHRERASKMEIYTMFKNAFDEDGMKTQDFVLNPFSSLVVEFHKEGQISRDEAFKYQELIRKRLAKGLEECEGEYCRRWKIIAEYTPIRLEYFETVKGFYSCDYYMKKYYPEFEENPDDCKVVRTVYSRLKFAGCPEDEPRFKELIRVGNERCRPKAPRGCGGHRPTFTYLEAIDSFKVAIEREKDTDKKAQYALAIAKIYQIHLRRFPLARTWAEKAAEYLPGWGEPYILIGRLYASSGPLCGPGRGWNSQAVIWPAIDMWQMAKRIDPGAAEEADKWIKRYSQYMPTREEVVERELEVGQEYFVGCWIQRPSTIRVPD